MAEAGQKDSWERTSWLLAKIHNVNCTRTSDMIEPRDANPMRRDRRTRAQQTNADFHAAMCDALAAAEAKEGK